MKGRLYIPILLRTRFNSVSQNKLLSLCSTPPYRCKLHSMSKTLLRKGDAKPTVQPDIPMVYSYRFSPYAQRVRLLLTAKDISHEVIECHLMHKPEWLLEANPRGQVPTLLYKGHTIAESVVICELIEELFPDKQIHSADPFQRAQDRVTTTILQKTVDLFYKAHLWNPNDKEVMDEFNKSLDSFETYFKGNDSEFLSGAQWGFGDLMAWPFFERFSALLGDTMDRLPSLAAWTARMAALPVTQACATPHEDMVTFYKELFSGNVLTALDM